MLDHEQAKARIDVDVIIAGAGPIGLTLACALHHHGVSCRIFERRCDRSSASKGHTLIARTQELLQSIGVRAALACKAYRGSAGQIMLDRVPLAHLEEGTGSPYIDVLLSSQDVIEEVLADRLEQSGTRVERGREVFDFIDGGEVVEVKVRDTPKKGHESEEIGLECLRCRYLVGADGVKGKIRKLLGLDFEAEQLPKRAIRQVDAKLTWRRSTSHDKSWFFLFENGFGGVLPVWENLYRFFLMEDQEKVPQRDPTLEEMNLRGREMTGDPTFTMSELAWASWGKFEHGVSPAYGNGNVFLAGDAGHTTLPIGGQGMNTGLQDSVDLAWRLAMTVKGLAGPLILDSYSPERQGAHADLGKQQVRGFNQLMYRGRTADAIVQAVSGLIPNLASKVFGGDDLAQLSLGYRQSALSEDHFSHLNPARREAARAGDRAPDARLVTKDGIDTTLFQHLYNPDGWTCGWRFLLFDGRDASALMTLRQAVAAVAETTWIRPMLVIADAGMVPVSDDSVPIMFDLDEAAHRAYGLVHSPALVLVRPDGHIAFRAPAEAVTKLRQYCHRVSPVS